MSIDPRDDLDHADHEPREVDAEVAGARVLKPSTIVTLREMMKGRGRWNDMNTDRVLDSHEALRERLVMLRGAVVLALQPDRQAERDRLLRDVLAITLPVDVPRACRPCAGRPLPGSLVLLGLDD